MALSVVALPGGRSSGAVRSLKTGRLRRLPRRRRIWGPAWGRGTWKLGQQDLGYRDVIGIVGGANGNHHLLTRGARHGEGILV